MLRNNLNRQEKWRAFYRNALIIGLLLFTLKYLAGMLYDYRWYFPANFEMSSFLTDRESYFHGWYRAAFYLHIVVSPIALLLAITLMLTGNRPSMARHHRWIGISLIALVLCGVCPSGLVMSTRAYTGIVAGVGLALLAVSTGITAYLSMYYARKRNLRVHRIWSTRCFLLLASPLLLRLLSAIFHSLDIDSGVTYQISTWVSWIIPLVTFEFIRRTRRTARRRHARPKLPRSTDTALPPTGTIQ